MMLAVPADEAGAADANPQVLMKTSLGEIVIELYPEKAPKSVENFLKYVDDKHYNGLIFHRVIGNFMIQGGGFDKDMKQKPTRAPIPLESRNGLKNDTGTHRDGAHQRARFGHLAVLHQHRQQRQPELSPIPTATAMRSSARSSRAWRRWRRSPR